MVMFVNQLTKEKLSDLAVFGGEKAFDEVLHVGRPNVGNRQRLSDRFDDLLDRNWLTNGGPLVKELEERLAKYLGVRHCIPICNGTVALEIAIRALDLKGEVIVPSFTFVATAHALQWQEITPIFCDINPHTHKIDPSQIERLVTPRTTGIIGVHLWGAACDIDALAEIADRKKLKLMFDAAHAFSCSYRGEMIGGFGDAEVFSFHATKFFNTIEGGAIATNDDDLARKIRLMKNFGFVNYDHVAYVGTNGKMNEFSAAMGLTNLEQIDQFITANSSNYQAYRAGLDHIPGIRMMHYNEREQCNYQYIVIELEEVAAGLSRDELQKVLVAENVYARRYFHPGCHKMEPYRSYYPNAGLLLPNTERVSERVLALPTGTAMNEERIHKVCEIIQFAISQSQDIKKKLG
jgi:dTDP-4-amino-4,6-dideoxygalactose transaminase